MNPFHKNHCCCCWSSFPELLHAMTCLFCEMSFAAETHIFKRGIWFRSCVQTPITNSQEEHSWTMSATHSKRPNKPKQHSPCNKKGWSAATVNLTFMWLFTMQWSKQFQGHHESKISTGPETIIFTQWLVLKKTHSNCNTRKMKWVICEFNNCQANKSEPQKNCFKVGSLH